MEKPLVPENEEERLKALKNYHVLDTLPESDFDALTHIAAQICGTPISLVSLVDEERQWFKSRHGLDAEQTPRDLAFCAHAINAPEELLVVNDSLKDPRFADNPLVTMEPHVRFYAGAPLVDPEGHPLGSLCVIDHEPRELTEAQLSTLTALAHQVIGQLELRKKVRELEAQQRDLAEANEELKKFAYIASHDLKTPLRGMMSIIEWIRSDCGEELSPKTLEYLALLEDRSDMMVSLVNGILAYSSATSRDMDLHEVVEVEKVVAKVQQLVEVPDGMQVNYPDLKGLGVTGNSTAMVQIFQNLIGNAINYHNKDDGWVELRHEVRGTEHCFEVADNGPGIDPKYHARIFEIFQVLDKSNRFGERGTGIGLATVKKLVRKMNGRISIHETEDGGATFLVAFPV